jgi:plastocyanin
MVRRSLGVASGALAIVLAITPLSGAAARPVRAITADNATGFAFDPDVKRVRRGASVKWVNTTGQAHTVVFYKRPAKLKKFTLNPEGSSGDSKSRRFPKRGIYKYFCTQQGHAIKDGDSCTGGMCGKIRVRASSTAKSAD